MKSNLGKELQDAALAMAVYCVRNTIIEDYHSGTTPKSKTGDYSDVKVVTPYGEIPWNELSRISDDEMKMFNKEVVDRIYTALQFFLNPEQPEDHKGAFRHLLNMYYPSHWDKPKMDEGFLKGIEIAKGKNNES